jgi:hypothetical protein
MTSWAKCKTCGEEVVFDAHVDLRGNVVSTFDANYCPGCEGSVGWDGYEEVAL